MSVESVKKNALTVIEEASNINTRYGFDNLSKKLSDAQKTVGGFKINAPLIGLFSAGKSSILNKYLNIDLPVGIEAKTSVACEFVYDTDEYLEVISDKNESNRKNISELKDLTIENCSFVRMHLNNNKLANLKDITIVDMPGLDSGYEQHNKAIKNYINSASYFIIIMDIENGTIKKSLLDFLKELDLYSLNFGFILSKYEQKDEADIENIIKTTKENILNFIGKDVFVGKVSVFDSDIADFEKILSNMQVVAIAKNCLYSNLKSILEEDLLKELNRKLKYDRFDIGEINKNIRELEKKSQDIEKSIEKEAYFIKNKANNQLTDAIISDISNTLSENVDMLVMKAKENSSSFGETINQLIRPVIASSSDRHLKELFSEIYGRLQVNFNSIVGDLQIDSINIGSLEEGNKLIDAGVNVVMEMLKKYLPTAGVATAGTLVATAAVTSLTMASVAIPIVGALVAALIPFFGNLLKSNREASQNENIKSQILGNIIPNVLLQIRNKLDGCISEQTDAFIKAVREKFDIEQNSIKEALEKAKKDKEISENEFNEKLEILKADIDKTEKLISELNINEG